MNKKSVIISIAIILVLVIALVVLLALYDFKPANTDDVQIVVNGNQVATIDYNWLRQNQYKKEFVATLKESGKPARQVNYTGISLTNVLQSLQIDISGVAINAVGYDGVVKAYANSQLSDAYLVFLMDGKQINGKKDGGYGAFMIVETNSVFSQGWCKYLSKIEVVTK